MSDDLVKRLREKANIMGLAGIDEVEAADALDRLAADLRVKQIVADEAMARCERQDAVIAELARAARPLADAWEAEAGSCDCGGHGHAMRFDPAAWDKLARALSLTPVAALERHKARQAVIEAARQIIECKAWRARGKGAGSILTVDPDAMNDLVDALAALAEQEAKE